ncbi:hypothetical protein S4054249_17320 [Pseudoalteromonas luteoviolacea]|uniref:Cobalamin-independent methionine synthase MetE N-terminal domain-containing protein n=1 Tax=Pseudoalteromonas luteoviolacea S4054 TaxID=1129367 RepID=A0A0F6A411_9GAMM|nr:hypothetical protein S4054249_17320 [Pseudoalteromonas luteoviolacea]AOT14408.1 hypothetical protein S40542_17290 [Pseudoalteromonas luteoviolacea]AOT19324.1 hypothetical protein S4054_17295 [Pseudoalteromonas luteoviolacea]KKE80930.1 hypothetical protein N479_24235 [Pseudoalteromonas luteoviolacea S4054]KZN65294.1 hypothetical protein N481_02545 [Pseudoalteromonas luteoviolacea S4047-1]
MDVNLTLASYFDSLTGYFNDIATYLISGAQFDWVSVNLDIHQLHFLLRPEQILSLGVVNGRSSWCMDLQVIDEGIKAVVEVRSNRLWIAPSCLLLHSLDDEVWPM